MFSTCTLALSPSNTLDEDIANIKDERAHEERSEHHWLAKHCSVGFRYELVRDRTDQGPRAKSHYQTDRARFHRSHHDDHAAKKECRGGQKARNECLLDHFLAVIRPFRQSMSVKSPSRTLNFSTDDRAGGYDAFHGTDLIDRFTE
ncbi:MAG: hypothetical protein ACXV4C_00025 [Halobacteriota archaeon]